MFAQNWSSCINVRNKKKFASIGIPNCNSWQKRHTHKCTEKQKTWVLAVEQMWVFGDNFAYFSIKTYVVGTEAILMSTHNMYFMENKKKLIMKYPPYLFHCFVCLCWGLTSQSTIFQSYRDRATTSLFHCIRSLFRDNFQYMLFLNKNTYVENIHQNWFGEVAQISEGTFKKIFLQFSSNTHLDLIFPLAQS